MHRVSVEPRVLFVPVPVVVFWNFGIALRRGRGVHLHRSADGADGCSGSIPLRLDSGRRDSDRTRRVQDAVLLTLDSGSTVATQQVRKGAVLSLQLVIHDLLLDGRRGLGSGGRVSSEDGPGSGGVSGG